MISGAILLWLVLVFATPLGKIWTNDSDRKRVVGFLLQNRGKTRYARVMRRLLDWIDDTLSAPEQAAGHPPWRIAWSQHLLILTSALALLYPIGASLAQWGLGGAITFGGMDILAPGDLRERLVMAGVLIGAALCLWLARRPKSLWRWPLFIAATAILLMPIFGPAVFDLPEPIAGAFAVAVAVAFVGAVAAVFPDAFTVAFAAAFAAAGTAALALAVAVALATAVAFPGAFVFPGAVAVALAVDWFEDRRGPSPVYRLAFSLLWLIALTLAVLLGTPQAGPTFALNAYIILLFGTFPLLNLLADFASIGLTRHLLRRGVDTWAPGRAVLDGLGGVLIFALLGMSMIAWVHFVRFPDGSALFDLPTFFDTMETGGGGYGWLGFMLLTTLLPTLLHLMIGMFTLGLSYPRFVRAPIAQLLVEGENSDTSGWLGSVLFCALISASIWVVVVLVALLIQLGHGRFLDQIIGGFAWFARLIGAI